MQLIPIENVNAIELFSNEKSIQAVLDEIKEAATDFEPDVSTPDGRKEIAAQAYKVSISKADRLERDRLRLIADNEREAQARAADTENRRKVNNSIVDALVAGGVSRKAAIAVVTLVSSGKVPAMAIRY